MEFTITTVVYLLAGVMILGVSLLIYMYFNGGVQTNIDLILGVLK
jgi:hypothetical protein